MRKVFRHYGPWIVVGLIAIVGPASTVSAASPNASGPTLRSPTLEAALVQPARQTGGGAIGAKFSTPSGEWGTATVSDRDDSVTAMQRSSRSSAQPSDHRYSTASQPVEPAFSQAVANSWRRSSRANVRPRAVPKDQSIAADEAPLPATAIAQVAAIGASTADANSMPALTAPGNSPSSVVHRHAATKPAASPRLTPTATQPSRLRQTARHAAGGPVPGSSTMQPSPREPLAATAAPLAEGRGRLGHRVARVRSVMPSGRTDVKTNADASSGSPRVAGSVRQASDFEGTVIRDVPAAEAEMIPGPESATATDATGLADSTTAECSDCDDACADDCCTKRPRRRPLLALNDKLDECKAKCCACCNQESWSNCNCNGSYKFPVPPLYTYHWPGLYSAELMTDYHSPWRFPPLKPYTDEVPRAGEGPPQPLTMVVPTSHRQPTAAKPEAGAPTAAAKPRPVAAAPERIIGEPEPMSKKICRAYGMKE